VRFASQSPPVDQPVGGGLDRCNDKVAYARRRLPIQNPAVIQWRAGHHQPHFKARNAKHSGILQAELAGLPLSTLSLFGPNSKRSVHGTNRSVKEFDEWNGRPARSAPAIRAFNCDDNRPTKERTSRTWPKSRIRGTLKRWIDR
jgi:hypothetical protein